MKNEVLILGIITMIAVTFGCTSSMPSSKQPGSSINFQIPEGWELHPMPGDGDVIWMGSDPRIRIIEMKNKQSFESKYKKALGIDKDLFMIKAGNKTIDGVRVEFFKTTDNRYGDIQDEYFFSKNNKYYYMMAWAYTGWNSAEQHSVRDEVDRAVDTIVKTIT